jgi:hypothetical protein
LAVSWINNNGPVYQQPAIESQLARADIAIILTWPGWSSGVSGIEPVLESIKGINPNILMFEYIKNNEIDGTQATNAPYGALFNKLGEMNWYLYASGGSGTPLPSSWTGATSINNTIFTPRDSNGDNWLSWFAKWAVATLYAPNPSYDGFSVDNVYTKPRVNGDWNRDGVTDSMNSTLAGQWQRQGYASFFATLHSLMPGKFQIGNIAD